MTGMKSEADKLNFLKCSLMHRVLQIINHFTINNSNYGVALSILKKKFFSHRRNGTLYTEKRQNTFRPV